MRLVSRHSAFVVAAFLFAPLWASPAGAVPQRIGEVELVRVWAYGTPVEQSRRDLLVEEAVFGNEVVETVRDGALHLRFADDTVFRLGSNSRAVLDKFVYDPDTKAGEIAVSLSQGLFRYISGALKGEAITIRTPTAIITLRGSESVICVSTGLNDPICPGPVGTTKVWPKVGQAILKSIADATREVVAAGGAGAVAPGGSAMPSEDPVPPADVKPGKFEADPNVEADNTGEGEGGSASAGQTPAGVSTAAVFGGDGGGVLDTELTNGVLAGAGNGAGGLGSLGFGGLLNGTTNTVVTAAVVNNTVVTGANGSGQIAGFPNGNGGFETGNFTGYDVSGQAAVIESLGALTPPEGQFMAFLSTGGAAVGATTSTLTTEPFNLPGGVNFISFEFNFLSNEFPNFVGTVFNDTLVATINDTQAYTQETVLASVNSSTFVPAPGTGFNGMTGFDTVQLDVSQFVGTGDLTLEFKVFDQGDTVVDSAVLLDNLQLVSPGS